MCDYGQNQRRTKAFCHSGRLFRQRAVPSIDARLPAKEVGKRSFNASSVSDSFRREEILLPDLQRIQCRIVDPASDGQLLDGLEPANRFPRSWPDKPIDWTVIETKFR